MNNITSIFSIALLAVLTTVLPGNKDQHSRKQLRPVPEASTDCSKAKGIEQVICLAEAFKATLKDDQLTLLQLAYSKKDAVRWSNFPQAFSRPDRVGLALGSLNETQLAAAKALMASVLARGAANEGYEELEGIFAADDFFGQKTGQTGTFGRGNYLIAFLGKPGTTGLWELQFGGHHVAFANTYNAGKITGVTPTFRGVEPATPVTANGKTYQPMEQERAAFAKMIDALNSAQKSSAKLSFTFNDVLLGPGQDGKFPNTKAGVKAGDLNSDQQKLLITAIQRYVNDLDPETARQVMAKYTAELADTYIAYAGSGTMNQSNDYVRLDGPGIWIEYSCQPSRDFPGTTHPHSVWRDHKSDYGGN